MRFILILIFSTLLTAYTEADAQYRPYRSYPVGMSKKRFKQIQARKYQKREVAVVPKQFRYNAFDRMRASKTTNVKYVNANAINRKKNQQLAAKKRKMDNRYQEYREGSYYANTGNPKSNFSIYDK